MPVINAQATVGQIGGMDSAPVVTKPPALSGKTFNPPNGTTGKTYFYLCAPLFNSGDVRPENYSIIGTLPGGLIFNTSNGIISGSPTVTGTFTGLDVTATNSFGSVSSADSADIVIN
ncbi:MAG: hypothetical protein DRQ46_07950 [Gammaproteobacteria bacterium]|nr:MAG: hypothetical protein DRQ46_07950 [Gammaproteobacteria bacterium]